MSSNITSIGYGADVADVEVKSMSSLVYRHNLDDPRYRDDWIRHYGLSRHEKGGSPIRIGSHSGTTTIGWAPAVRHDSGSTFRAAESLDGLCLAGLAAASRGA